MATVTGYTAARMKAIEDKAVVSGTVINGNLVLTTRDGTQIVSGPVIGPTGATGTTGPAGPGVVRIPHTWHIPGEVLVATGDTDIVLPFWIPVKATKTSTLVRYQCRITSGTSVNFTITRNGTGIPNFSNLIASTTAAGATPTAVSLTDMDMLSLVINSVSGTPKNLAVTIHVDYAS